MKPISTVWIAIDISKKQLKKEFIHILIDDSYDTVLSRLSKL
jgi:predicted DNA-binding protein (MmcQ/YjbR family)